MSTDIGEGGVASEISEAAAQIAEREHPILLCDKPLACTSIVRRSGARHTVMAPTAAPK